MLLSVSVSLFSVIASCAPTSSRREVLDVMQAGKHTSTPEHERNNDMDKYNHLTTDSTVADVVNNHSFMMSLDSYFRSASDYQRHRFDSDHACIQPQCIFY